MTECRHGTDLAESDCMNCENDDIAFDEWWADRFEKDDGQYGFAKSAWEAAIKHIVEDMSLGL